MMSIWALPVCVGIRIKQKLLEHIHVTTLDQVLKINSFACVDLIKIDIESGEYYCLLGAKKLLEIYHPMLIIEEREYSIK